MTRVSVSEASRNLSHWINEASYGGQVVIVTSRGKPKAVIMGMEAFEELIGIDEYLNRELMPLDEFRREFRAALEEAGYHTPDDIVHLVREVRQELAAGEGDMEPDSGE